MPDIKFKLSDEEYEIAKRIMEATGQSIDQFFKDALKIFKKCQKKEEVDE